MSAEPTPVSMGAAPVPADAAHDRKGKEKLTKAERDAKRAERKERRDRREKRKQQKSDTYVTCQYTARNTSRTPSIIGRAPCCAWCVASIKHTTWLVIPFCIMCTQ